MNTLVRKTLSTAVLAGVLFTASGCGGAAPGDVPKDQSQTQAPQQVEAMPKGGAKSVSFESPLRLEFKAPEKWAGGSGWSHSGVDQMVGLKNHIAYSFSNESTHETGMEIYNADGESVAKIGVPSELSGGKVLTQRLFTTWQDGKMYTVYTQTGYGANHKPEVVVTAFDENANQTKRTVSPLSLEAGFDWIHGALVYKDMLKKGEHKIFNPKTGEFESLPGGDTWVARIDGVDLLSKDNTLTNGSWTRPDASPSALGKYASLSVGNDACEIIDPHTGKTVEGSNGGCAPHIESGSLLGGSADPDTQPQSYTEKYILTKSYPQNQEKFEQILFDPAAGKSVSLGTKTQYKSLSVDATGVFYGIGSGDTGFTLDPKKDTSPTPLTGKAPVLITNNGIAAFARDTVDNFHGNMTFILPKK